MTKLIKKDSWILPVVIMIVISTGITFTLKTITVTPEFQQESLSKNLPEEKIEEVLINKETNSWISYIFIPAIELILIIIISSIILIGVHLKSYNLKFRKIMVIVAYSSLIFLLLGIVKILNFYLSEEQLSLEEFNRFSPHSLLYYLDKEAVSKLLLYPLYLVNAYQIIFMLALSFGIKSVSELSFFKSSLLILQTYGLSLLFWALIVVFLFVIIS